MIQALLIITWIVFGAMAAFALFYKNHQDNQVLGVTISYTHANSPEVQETVKGFKIACYLVLLLSLGFSLLMLIKVIGPYVEFYMLVLVMANLLANWFVIHRYQQRLIDLKRVKGWSYQRKRVVTVDINVAKEKGKSGVSPVWTWSFLFLSFIPTIYLFLSAEARAFYPLGFSLIGPFCQLSTVLMYYYMRRYHTPVLSDNTEVNKACARTEEGINTKAATFSALAMLLFWFLFSFTMIHFKSSILIVLSVVILVAALLLIAYWQQKKIRVAENYFFGKELKDDSNITEQEGIWKWGCYYNPNDSRIFVPKRLASMGWTINIGNRVGKAIGIGTLVLLLVVFVTVFYGGTKDYVITENGSQISIDAAMYDMSIEKNQIVSVSTIDSIPKGLRTN
ncbi:MAG: DUF5808 domain-containing protein, partial [Eubacteriales bacterium]